MSPLYKSPPSGALTVTVPFLFSVDTRISYSCILSETAVSFPIEREEGTDTIQEGEDVSSSISAEISISFSSVLSSPSVPVSCFFSVSQYIVTIVFTLNLPFSNRIPLISPFRLLMAGT